MARLPRSLIGASVKPFVLSILAHGPTYGYELIQRVQTATDGKIVYTTSTLYPVLHAMESAGLLESYWVPMENAPRRKYYRLTKQGEAAYAAEQALWTEIYSALQLLWNAAPSLETT